MADAATAAPGIGIPAQNPLAPAKDASALLSTSCIAREPPRGNLATPATRGGGVVKKQAKVFARQENTIHFYSQF